MNFNPVHVIRLNRKFLAGRLGLLPKARGPKAGHGILAAEGPGRPAVVRSAHQVRAVRVAAVDWLAQVARAVQAARLVPVVPVVWLAQGVRVAQVARLVPVVWLAQGVRVAQVARLVPVARSARLVRSARQARVAPPVAGPAAQSRLANQATLVRADTDAKSRLARLTGSWL
jgi:hypothetical protein